MRYISIHDNWVYGDDSPYEECKEMAVFNDLECIFVTQDIRIFELMAEGMRKSPREFFDFWSEDEKLVRRPYCCGETRRMYEESMGKIRSLLDKM